ncbi:MAG: hypothetical protein ACYC35_18400 [Pirellulales bacterium]
MHRHRGILVAVGIAVLALVSSVAAYQMYQYRLPNPDDADCAGLLKWMVLRDLRQESPELNRKLVHRLEQELRAGLNWQEAGAGLDESQREKTWNNVTFLVQLWFTEKVDGYFRCAASKRLAFLDEQIDVLKNLRGVAELLPAAERSGTGGGEMAGVAALMGQVEQWIQQAAPNQRPRMREFLLAVQLRFLARSLQSKPAQRG